MLRYVTMQYSWIITISLLSQVGSLTEWTITGESRVNRPKAQKSADRVVASIFWDAGEMI